MKQYSADLRERLLGAIDAGLPQAEAARLFGVHPSTIKRWRQRQRATGTVAAQPRPGRRRRIDGAAARSSSAQLDIGPVVATRDPDRAASVPTESSSDHDVDRLLRLMVAPFPVVKAAAYREILSIGGEICPYNRKYRHSLL